ncbi:MAG: hypothetical protein J6P49_00650 [Paludibacteraceae bacterium]|nr:hypothetical protein [Paludibacteraceae bacterium]MBO7337729.1 hypothetical protein [Paludibacteraceae bacterium]MBP5136962.1 hypothetical protein [Paludibacteraceae bacterium]MBP5742017.1 hypothetical protein [Paludibacteraceae bacterium]
MKIKGLIKGVKGVMEDAMNGNYLSYKYVRKMYGTMFILAILGFVYIYSRYKSQISIREQRVLTIEIEDLRSEYLSISTELTQMKRASVMEDSVAKYDPELKASHTASFMISK